MADPHCSQGAALQQKCGEIAPVDLTNSETASYVHLLFEWVRQWDRMTRHAVVLEQGFYRTGGLSVSLGLFWYNLSNILGFNRESRFLCFAGKVFV